MKWYEGYDGLEINGFWDDTFEISGNNPWEASKRFDEDYPLYIAITNNSNVSVGMPFTFEEMVKIRDYLNHKIDYLSDL